MTEIHEPGDPDAALVEKAQWQRHRDHREHVGRGADDGGEDKQEDDGVGAGARHEFVGDKAEAHERQDHDRQLEREAERDREAGDEGIIFLDRPGGNPAERLGVAKEKQNRFGQEPVIGSEHAGQEQAEADENSRQHQAFLHRGERRQDELRHEIKQERKRDDDAGVKGEPERDRERIGDGERAQGADARIDVAQRPLHDLDERVAKDEAQRHRRQERDGHLHDGPAQVFEVLEKRLGGFALRLVSKFKNVAQSHDAQSWNERKPRASNRAQIASVLASRISLFAIMPRNSSALKARQSRIDSDSSWEWPAADSRTGRARKK